MNSFIKRALSFVLAFVLAFGPEASYAQSLFLPEPGAMVQTSPAFVPVIMKGLTIHPDNPLLFDFIVDTGNSGLKQGVDDVAIKAESSRLVKYFLASLAIPEKDQWVNLSPYEKDRILPEELGKTELGRDMLAQDYLLKQVTSSMIHPDKALGKEFWARIYARAQKELGTTEIPLDTFNKVWITADKADVFVKNNTAFIVGSHLKVQLETDYLAQSVILRPMAEALAPIGGAQNSGIPPYGRNDGDDRTKQLMRSIILPELEKEVNTGKNFAALRQIFHSMILATWYKKNLKDALLSQVYADQKKTNGVEGLWVKDAAADIDPQQVWQKYEQAYKVGVFNFIKEDIDQATGDAVPHKYFSGGVSGLGVAHPVSDFSPSQAVTAGPVLGVSVAMEKIRALPSVEEVARLEKQLTAGIDQVLDFDALKALDRKDRDLVESMPMEWLPALAAKYAEERYLKSGRGFSGVEQARVARIIKGDQREYAVHRQFLSLIIASLADEYFAPILIVRQKSIRRLGDQNYFARGAHVIALIAITRKHPNISITIPGHYPEGKPLRDAIIQEFNTQELNLAIRAIKDAFLQEIGAQVPEVPVDPDTKITPEEVVDQFNAALAKLLDDPSLVFGEKVTLVPGLVYGKVETAGRGLGLRIRFFPSRALVQSGRNVLLTNILRSGRDASILWDGSPTANGDPKSLVVPLMDIGEVSASLADPAEAAREPSPGEIALDNAKRQFEEFGARIKMDPAIMKILLSFFRIIEVDVTFDRDVAPGGSDKIKKEQMTVKGYRVYHSAARGAGKGGLRYAADMDLFDAMALSMWMTIKNAIVGIPFGGAKGGIAVDPRKLSAGEKARMTRAFLNALLDKDPRAVGPLYDVPAGDLNTTEVELGQFSDEYVKRTQGHLDIFQTPEFKAKLAAAGDTGTPYSDAYYEWSRGSSANLIVGSPLGMITGKPLRMGGSRGRAAATGRGVFFITREAQALYGAKLGIPSTIKGTTYAIQGGGAVGGYAAKFYDEAGGKVGSLQDINGSIVAVGDKIDVKHLYAYLEQDKARTIITYAAENSDKVKVITSDEFWASNVDVLVPAATTDQINAKNRHLIKAKMIVEGANGPIGDRETDKYLNDKGIMIMPDVLANAGGVFVSVLEWYQNNLGEQWPEIAVNKRLENALVNAFLNVRKLADVMKVSFREAAYVVAFAKVADAIVASDPQLAATLSASHPAFVLPEGIDLSYPETVDELNIVQEASARQALMRKFDRKQVEELAHIADDIVRELRPERGNAVLVDGPRANGKHNVAFQLQKLLREKGVKARIFDLEYNKAEQIPQALSGKPFTFFDDSGKSEEARVAEDELLIVVGVGAFDENVQKMIPGGKYPVYVYSAPDMLLKGNWALSSFDLRFMRDVLASIKTGTEKNIFEVIERWHTQRIPEIEKAFERWGKARVSFNSYLPYEVAVLKAQMNDMINNALASYDGNDRSREEYAYRVLAHLKKILSGVEPWDASLLAKDSLMLDFIQRYGNGSAKKRNTVLIIDDGEGERSMMNDLIERLYPGAERVVKEDGQEALDFLREKANRDTVATVITDTDMPRVNGYELIDRIRAEFSGDKILDEARFFALSGVMGEDKQAAYREAAGIEESTERPEGAPGIGSLVMMGKIPFIRATASKDRKLVLMDSAQGPVGGIDLDANKMTLTEGGTKVDMDFDPAMVEDFKKGNFSGITPVILNITPIPSLAPLMGVS